MTARVSLEEIIARGSWGLAEVYINEGEGVVKTASVRPTHETVESVHGRSPLPFYKAATRETGAWQPFTVSLSYFQS